MRKIESTKPHTKGILECLEKFTVRVCMQMQLMRILLDHSADTPTLKCPKIIVGPQCGWHVRYHGEGKAEGLAGKPLHIPTKCCSLL